ncbi:MAG: energy-coupling factor transporter transmembrane protein EcfT [Lautropia sp.]|nr:energy-coupling factor transporter transmembrane protein EcfT [Lautropia sp.]
MGSLYSETPGWLHPVPAWLKLLLMAVLGTVLFWLHTPPQMLVAAGCALLLWLSLGRATRPARRLMLSVLFTSALVAAFQWWSGRPVLALTSSLRLASACCLGIALTVTTRPADILDVLERLLSPLRRIGMKPERIALQMGLMLRFIEHFLMQWKKLDDAHRLRTGKAGGLRLIAPLTIQLLQTARRVGDALYARLGD